MQVVTGDKTYFPNISQIQFEGRESKNPFAFKFYNPEQVVAGKTMAEHFKFAVCYWHSFCFTGTDPFGRETRMLPWNASTDKWQRATDKMDAAFEFFTKLGTPYYCFHDVDLIDDSDSLVEYEDNLKKIVEYAKQKQKDSGIKLLWGTANLTGNPRYMNGAATNPDFNVLACAATQVKNTLDATIALGGENYVFWGGREGYLTLLNTDMKRELEHLAQFFHLARDYGRKQGFKGNFLIEPKPCEPSKHQYDFDCATVIAFLREYNLMDDFKLNIEVNHATLAGHTFQHELQVAANAGLMASIDANRGDAQNGWDTDQFAMNLNDMVETMLVILENGGLKGGGVNFDAKIRRNSTDLEDLFLGHIGSMDAFARALLVANDILENSDYKKIKEERYASYNNGEGADFEAGKLSLEDLRNLAVEQGQPQSISGKQELIENIINEYI